MSIASLIFGIIGISSYFIPGLNNFSIIFVIIGIILAIIGLVKKSKKGIAIVGIIICVIIGIMYLTSQQGVADSINEMIGAVTKLSSDEILSKYLDVEIGEFTETEGEKGKETSLPIKVTNKDSKTRSFYIKVEAVRADGSKIMADDSYIQELGAGESRDISLYEFVTDDNIEDVRNGTFKVVEASIYED